MERIYKPFIGKTVKSEDIDIMLKNQEFIVEIVKASFYNVYFKGYQSADKITLAGRNWLIFEVVMKYVNQLLTVDQKRAPFVISGLEKVVQTTIKINNSTQTVTIGGTIDRIDVIGESTYVFDYKTGKTDLSYPVLSSLFDSTNKTRNKAAFQTLVYSYILHKNSPEMLEIYPGVYSLRGIFEADFEPLLRSKEIGNKPVEFVSFSDQFEHSFRQLLEEIFNMDIPFQQTENEENCKYCSYKQICRR